MEDPYPTRGTEITLLGTADSAALCDCNIPPFARINLFVVFNVVSNRLVAPFTAREPRPEFIGAREHASVLPRRQSQ